MNLFQRIRMKAYCQGYTDGLGAVRDELFADSHRRLRERDPHDLHSLADFVMSTITSHITRGPFG